MARQRTWGGWGAWGGTSTASWADPTVATAEKGEKWLNIGAKALADFILEWKKMPIKSVADHY